MPSPHTASGSMLISCEYGTFTISKSPLPQHLVIGAPDRETLVTLLTDFAYPVVISAPMHGVNPFEATLSATDVKRILILIAQNIGVE
jgi:hypothetical protein